MLAKLGPSSPEANQILPVLLFCPNWWNTWPSCVTSHMPRPGQVKLILVNCRPKLCQTVSTSQSRGSIFQHRAKFGRSRAKMGINRLHLPTVAPSIIARRYSQPRTLTRTQNSFAQDTTQTAFRTCTIGMAGQTLRIHRHPAEKCGEFVRRRAQQV